MLKYIIYITLLFISFNGKSQNIDSLFTDVFFDSNFPSLDLNNFSFSTEYYESSSTWAITDSFPESVVFRAEMAYNSMFDSTQSYKIRIGNGGQLYSFRGVFGESVPPQWRPESWVKPHYGGGTAYAPWSDEIWQLISLDGNLTLSTNGAYEIHQAGVYLYTPAQTEPFYSPIIAEYFNPEEQSYTLVTWGLQSKTDRNLVNKFKSAILFYVKYTNKGHGIFQVDNRVYNFGFDDNNHINVPWGGVRESNLSNFFVSKPDNSYVISPGNFGPTPKVRADSTGGWVAYASDTLGNSPTLAIVFSLTTNGKRNLLRYGDAGPFSSTNLNRDYHVFTNKKPLWPGQMGHGKSMSYRYFFVLGFSVDSVRNTILQNNLVSLTLDTSYNASIAEVDSIYYRFVNQGDILVPINDNSDGNLLLRLQPYLNSFPLFNIKSGDTTNVISTDLYHYSDFPYDGQTSEIKLLGFLDKPSKLIVLDDTICKGESYVFPDSSLVNNIQTGFSQISKIPAILTGFDSLGVYDSLIVTNIVVREVIPGTDVQTACNSFEWIDGNTYTQSTDTAAFNIIGGAANGCDSLVTLDLTIFNSTSGIDVNTACNSFEWIDGNVYTESNNTATFNIEEGASNGCDSLVTLDLTINTVNVSVTIDDNIISAIESGASYQWLDCDNNYQEIPGETSQSFTAIINGNYAVEVSRNGCSDTSDCVLITVVGIIENELFNDVSIYPNPNNGIVNIELGKLSGVSLKVLGINGQLILEKDNINTSTFQFELIGSPGVYLIELSTLGQKQQFRILKE